MSKRGRSPRLDLRLNLSPANSSSVESWPSGISSEMTVEGSSCVSSEAEESLETTRAMLLVGCPRCLMYVMLSEVDPKCPRCKSTVLLDFLNEENTKKTTNN